MAGAQNVHFFLILSKQMDARARMRCCVSRKVQWQKHYIRTRSITVHCTRIEPRNRSRRHTCYQQKSPNSTRVYERFSFSLLNYAEMCLCFIETEIWNGRKVVNTPGNISDMFSGDASHSRRLFFRPAVGSLPSARHCSHVCGFLKSNLPFLPGRNCVRGMVRSHTWHVSGFAAASLDLCSFFC